MSGKNPKSNTSRRDFVKGTTIASTAIATGLVGVHTATGEQSSSKSANDTLNLALIGCGGRGGGATNDTMTINDNIRMIAMVDLDSTKCGRLATGMKARHGDKMAVAENKIYEGLDGYKKVLEDPDVDVVMLTTSPGFRPYHIAEAVEAGKHVFAEKPTCVDPAGYRVCLKAHEMAEKQKTAIVTGTQYRRQKNYIGAVEQIRKGMIGNIISATTRYCSTGIWYKGPIKEGMSQAEYQLRNWMHFIWLSGDQITEQAVHNIDTMNWVMGGPPEVAYGSGGRFTRPTDSEMWDNVEVDYTYPGNRVLSFMCRQIPNTRGENGNVIYGTEAVCYIKAGSSGSEILDYDGKKIWSMSGSIGEAYKLEHKALIDSIREGKPIVELEQTANSSLTAVMGRLAAYTGQKVTWDFVSKESKLDTFPKNLTMDADLPTPGYARPGTTRLV